jgi:aryl-alcohol dehydrogenase-like predicted oxidoreductase
MYLIHEVDHETPMEETLVALDELVRAGKVGAIGASNIDGATLSDALEISDRLGLVRFEWVQNSYSLLDRGAEDDVVPVCVEHGLGFTPFSPLAGGLLTGKYRPGETYPPGSRLTLRPEPYHHLMDDATGERIAAFVERADTMGVEPTALAIAWVVSHDAVTAVVSGPRRPEHLDTACGALDISLKGHERDELSALFA